MLKLRPIYPYDLNDRLGYEYKKKDTCVLESNKFPPLPRKHEFLVEQFIKTNCVCPDEILIVLKQYLSHNLSEVPNFCRASSSAMNKCYLKITAVLLQDNLDDDRNSIFFNAIPSMLLSLRYSNQRCLKLKEKHLLKFLSK